MLERFSYCFFESDFGILLASTLKRSGLNSSNVIVSLREIVVLFCLMTFDVPHPLFYLVVTVFFLFIAYLNGT